MDTEELKSLNVKVPARLFKYFSKVCVDQEITKTECIVRYIKYLRSNYAKNKQVLDEHSKDNFRLDE